MSIITPLTRLAVIAGGAGIIYASVAVALPNKASTPVEPGFANPQHVEFYKPKNESGNLEFFLKYDNGTTQMNLPILAGPNGPVVGSADYQWESMDVSSKSRLVGEGWSDLELDTRKSILKTELDAMLENYGGE